MIKSNIKTVFDCDRDKLWDTITDNHNYAWRTDLSKIEIIDETHFVEYTSDNYPTSFTITKKEKLDIYEFEIKNTNLKGKWIGRFRELENGTIELDFTEQIETTNWIMKLLAKPYLKKMQKRYIKDLKKELNRK